MSDELERAKRIFFHVGAPKTGTTYLQNVLYQNRATLAEHGVLYPYTDRGQSFRSMQDFRGVGWAGGSPGDFAGEWETVAERARTWSGPLVILSNELLGGSRPERIKAGVASVGPAEVHVVFTARDFARQMVSDWQEHIKHKHLVTLERFVDDLIELGLDAPAPFGELFWGMHDAAYVLRRWAGVIPPSHIHIVTVPQPGAGRDVLWRRFCAVTGLDPEAYDSVTNVANVSMGVAETELVRRMNSEVKGMAWESYDPLVRRFLAEEVLGGQSPKLALPTGRMEWVSHRSGRLIDELEKAGYPVEGDLAELVPRPADHEPYVSPTSLTEADLANAAIRAATALLRHSGRQRRRISELQQTLNGAIETPAQAPERRDPAPSLYRRTRSWLGRTRLVRRLRRRST